VQRWGEEDLHPRGAGEGPTPWVLPTLQERGWAEGAGQAAMRDSVHVPRREKATIW